MGTIAVGTGAWPNTGLTLLAATAVLLAWPSLAAVRRVPGGYPDIATAIQAAQSGDEVLVAPGTYTGPRNRELTTAGKAITIRSESGPAATILDCLMASRAFILTSGETRATVIEGFTIRNGRAQDGGGIGLWNNSSPTVRECVFKNCGGNGALGEGGGLRAAHGSDPLIENCTFDGCMADYGGGVMANASVPEIMGCTFENCAGAAIYLWDHADSLISGCVFRNNTDSSQSFGAGIACFEYSDAWIENSYLTGGTMTWDGAGINIGNAAPAVLHCTIVGNTGMNGTGGVMATSSNATLTNCIVWGNTGSQIRDSSGGLTVRHCNVQGGYPGSGNFDEPPGFAGPGDHHLASDSPCVDRGLEAGVTEDIDGDLRPQGSGPDVGCDELAPGIDCALSMPGHHFTPGDPCSLSLQIDNQGPAAGPLPVFVLLDVYGTYYFWPSWTSFDYSSEMIAAGTQDLTILPSFLWPEGAGTASGLTFLAGVTDTARARLMGNAGSWQFGFGE